MKKTKFTHNIRRSIERSILASLLLTGWAQSGAAEVQGWLDWRGPNQDGTSLETGLPDKWEAGDENQLWTFPMAGRGTPVIAGDRAYVWGYAGHEPDILEYLVCLNAKTGEEIWRKGFSDFLSDNVYLRYSIGSPAVDPETGNVYLLTTPGIFVCLAPDGESVFEVSLMEEFGRLTFPNGRTGAPVIEGDFAIVRGITSNWGSDGPARDRFYAFDKKTGELVWTSTPGETPQDSSFSHLVFDWANGKRVFYTGTGCGNVVCVNAMNGDPIWRFHLSNGGVNSTVALTHDNSLIAIHGVENVDTSETGRMVAIKLGAEPKEGEVGPAVLGSDYELWRNPLSMFTSSPVLFGDRLYQVTQTGDLVCVNTKTGEIVWEEKLAESQLHASPLYAEGKLYLPMMDGSFFIIRPSDEGPEILSKTQLEGNCIGSPSVWDGRIYVHTTEKLYCFGNKEGGSAPAPEKKDKQPEKSEPVELQIVPSEVLMAPGEAVDFTVYKLDKNGFRVGTAEKVSWEKFIPPTAKVKSEMNASFNEKNQLVAAPDAHLSAGSFKATADGLSGTIRGRILPRLPIKEDFESFEVAVPDPSAEGEKFAFPPLPWIGARFKFDIRDLGETQVYAKNLDRILFQRAVTFIGHPETKNYTMSADVMTDGNRRIKSSGGVINQRYTIAMIGNAQQIEVSSNHDRLKVSVPFKMEANKWYRLKTRVDVAEDGSGTVRAKAWPREESEPSEWTIEVPHKVAHTHGSPGLFAFAPQSKFKVYLDNIEVVSND